MAQNANAKEPVDLSLLSVLKIVSVLVGLYLLLKLSTLLLLFFLGSMLSVVLLPVSLRLQKLGLERKYSVTVIATVLLAAFVGITVLLVPAVTSQIVSLISAFPQIRTELAARIPDQLEFKTFLVDLLYSAEPPSNAVIMDHALTLIGGAVQIGSGFGLMWILSVYLLADGNRAFQWFADFFAAPTRMKLAATAKETSVVIAAYAKGQFITSIACTLFCFSVLAAFHVPGALTLATLAGCFDIIPIVGFFMGLLPAFLLAASVSSTAGLAVIILYTAYHLVEAYVIVPYVYGSRMKVSGLVVILALLISASIGGILFALAVLPIVASYPIIERIWLVKFLGRDVVNRHADSVENRAVPEQVKLWANSRLDISRPNTTLNNRDLSKHFRRRILIVEDDPDIRATLQDILETEGYHTFIASTGYEALTTLETVPGIGLVLMDINMPVMDGRQVFEIMKRMPNLASIPVVFLSASLSDHVIEGASGLLRKPAGLDEVINAVDSHYSRGNNGSLF